MKDFYYILGTQSNCSLIEITEAYHKLAKKLRPDSNEDDHFLRGHFQEISEAYEILSDPARRRIYDEALKRTHKKQLANFKTRPVNIMLTVALALFTAVFGFYVLRQLSAIKPATVVTKQPETTAAVIPHKAKHHNRKHVKAMLSAHNLPVAIEDTARMRSVKAAPAVTALASQPIVAKQGGEQAVVASRPVTVAPPVVSVRARVTVPDSSYNTYLKDNLAGSIYLHQQADYMSQVVTALPHHSRIKVLQKGRNFYKVAFNNQIGYLPKWTIADL